jgi:2-polyprenyl-6-methoxyphenol hydroxylase-like FAD-dependent oxidoreductase
MAHVVVVGAGLVGLLTSLLLSRDGHRVTVVERDPAAPPADPASAWRLWDRPGVHQFRQLHFMLPRWHSEMRRELPDVVDDLVRAGGRRLNLLRELPVTRTGGWRAGDERFDVVTARRPVLEAVLAAAVDRDPAIELGRGQAVTGLLVSDEPRRAVPHVTGVVAGGSARPADLVVDTGGRRSTVPALLAAAAGRRQAEHRERLDFVYYAQHFRDPDGRLPEVREPLLTHHPSVSLVVLPSDNGTWGVGIVASSRDRAVRALTDPEVFRRVICLFPAHAHWIDAAPVTGIQSFGGFEDGLRRFVIDSRPIVTGLVAVGDAWARTNPSLGRGAAIGVVHARVLRDVLRTAGRGADPTELVLRLDELTRTQVLPLIEATMTFDRHRRDEMAAEVAGERYRAGGTDWALTNAVFAAGRVDPDVLRAALDIGGLLVPAPQVLARPGLPAAVIAHGANAGRYPVPGPSRPDLLAALRAPVRALA